LVEEDVRAVTCPHCAWPQLVDGGGVLPCLRCRRLMAVDGDGDLFACARAGARGEGD
jgi:hypothetical protein